MLGQIPWGSSHIPPEASHNLGETKTVTGSQEMESGSGGNGGKETSYRPLEVLDYGLGTLAPQKTWRNSVSTEPKLGDC